MKSQVPWQGLHKNWRRKSDEWKSMEAMHGGPSRASEDYYLSYSHICLHHHFQHHFSTAPDVLSPTRKRNEHPDRKKLQHPSSFASIHSLHYANLSCPSVWNCLCTTCSKIHWKGLGNLASSKGGRRALYRYFLYGFGCNGWEEEKKLVYSLEWDTLHLLDCPTVSHLWSVRDVHCCGANRVFLQAVCGRDAILSNCYDLLFILIWVLFELPPCFASEQNNLKFCWWGLAKWQWPQQEQVGSFLLVVSCPQPHQLLHLPFLV